MAVVPLCRMTPEAGAPTPNLKVSTRPAIRRDELTWGKPVTTPVRPSLSRASEAAQQSRFFSRETNSLGMPSALIDFLSEAFSRKFYDQYTKPIALPVPASVR